MSVAPGTRLGPYEILGMLGAGGMGEVYKARDSRLDRFVAVKVLPPELAANPARRQRFEQEARAASALNHPHICVLHDIGSEAPPGSPASPSPAYLVMEYLEGQTLAERLTKGPLPAAQVLELGAQIASALAAAHRKGIVHRDVKPGNVMLTKSGVKLLDFGLARLTQVEPDGLPLGATVSAVGTIVGTARYMAPEQVQGQSTDARTDIFALGAVLYEMATGKPAFEGSSVAGIAGAILAQDVPAVSKSSRPVSGGFDALVARCLAKDPDARWQHALDVAHQLETIRQADGEERASPALGSRLPSAGIALAAVLAVTLGIVFFLRAPGGPRPQPKHLTLDLPSEAPLASPAVMPLLADKPVLALSRDGRSLAYVAQLPSGRSQIYLVDLETGSAAPVRGTEDGHTPVFSPDGSALAFFAPGSLCTVRVSGGNRQVLVDRASNPCGAAWGDDGFIYFNRMDGEGLLRVKAGGGDVERVFDEAYTQMPEYLGRGRELLAVGRTTVIAIDGAGKARRLLRGGTPRYVRTGHLLYSLPGQLMAVPFDPDRLEPVGQSISVADNLRTWFGYSTSQYAVSAEGTLAYAPGSEMSLASFAWVDRETGAARPLGLPQDAYGGFSISPDERLLAATLPRSGPQGGYEVRVFDVARGTYTVVDPKAPGDGPPAYDRWPLITPDGRRVLFSRGARPGPTQLVSAPLGPGSPPVVVWTSPPGGWPDWLYPMSFSPDGSVLSAFGPSMAGSSVPVNHLYTLPVAKPGGSPAENVEARLVSGGPSQQFFGTFSPGGRALAYLSDESGRWEIYVAPYPGQARACQLSRDGGVDPAWSADGSEVIFKWGTTIYAVPVQSVSDCRIGEPRALFSGPFPRREGYGLAVSHDGKRFLMLRNEESLKTTARIHVWTGFFEELRRRAPSDFDEEQSFRFVRSRIARWRRR